MKKISILIALTAVLTSCKNDDTQKMSTNAINNPMTLENAEKIDKDKLPIIKFELMEHDFGTVIEGEKVSFKFKFTNEGKSDLIINNASGSCGCTVPKAPELPIKPGKSEYIEAIFDSSNKEGPVEKTITVMSNTIPNSTELTIKATVIVQKDK